MSAADGRASVVAAPPARRSSWGWWSAAAGWRRKLFRTFAWRHCATWFWRTSKPGAVVSTDELMSYGLLTGDGYTHGAVKHGAKEWSWYDWRTGETFHTNSVEGFWRLFKSVGAEHPHSRQREADARLPRRVLLSVEPSAVRERDVRPVDFAGLTAARSTRSNAPRSAAGRPAVSCLVTNSDNRPARSASASVKAMSAYWGFKPDPTRGRMDTAAGARAA